MVTVTAITEVSSSGTSIDLESDIPYHVVSLPVASLHFQLPVVENSEKENVLQGWFLKWAIKHTCCTHLNQRAALKEGYGHGRHQEQYETRDE